MSDTAEAVQKAFVKAFKSTQNKLDIEPLLIDTTDKFQSTILYRKWIQNYDRLEAPYSDRDAKDRKQMLLINIGPEAAARFEIQPLETGEGDEYKNARATLERIYCVSQPKNESRVRFHRIEQHQNEPPIRFIERLRAATALCEFDEPGEEVMRMMLSKCTNTKWQEKRIIQNWTHSNLKDAEKYARQLEEASVLTKELRKNDNEGGRVNAVKAGKVNNPKCGNCGFNHRVGSCGAKNKKCYKCDKIGHYGAFCRSTQPRGRGRFNGRNSRNRYNGNRRGRGNYNNRGYRGRGRGGFRNSRRGFGRFGRGSYQGNNSSRGGQNQQNYFRQNQQVKAIRNSQPAIEYQNQGHATNQGNADSFNMNSFRNSIQELGYGNE